MYLIPSGSPAPKVKWFENGKELPTEANDFSYPSRTTNKLIVKNLARTHQHAIYTCQASNFPNKFVSKNITIELYCKYNGEKSEQNKRMLASMGDLMSCEQKKCMYIELHVCFQ